YPPARRHSSAKAGRLARQNQEVLELARRAGGGSVAGWSVGCDERRDSFRTGSAGTPTRASNDAGGACRKRWTEREGDQRSRARSEGSSARDRASAGRRVGSHIRRRCCLRIGGPLAPLAA